MSNVAKMKVSNSTKYCNYSVAAALTVLSDDTKHPENVKMKATAAFIEDLTRWYDLMNSRTDDDALKPSNRADYDSKINHLEMMTKLISEIKVHITQYILNKIIIYSYLLIINLFI